MEISVDFEADIPDYGPQNSQVKNEKNVPRGSIEPVPSRSGTGHEEKHPSNPLDDSGTEDRRAHYGEDPALINFKGTLQIKSDVNDVKTKRNQTMRDAIVLNSKSGYGRAMSA